MRLKTFPILIFSINLYASNGTITLSKSLGKWPKSRFQRQKWVINHKSKLLSANHRRRNVPFRRLWYAELGESTFFFLVKHLFDAAILSPKHIWVLRIRSRISWRSGAVGPLLIIAFSRRRASSLIRSMKALSTSDNFITGGILQPHRNQCRLIHEPSRFVCAVLSLHDFRAVRIARTSQRYLELHTSCFCWSPIVQNVCEKQ